MSLIHLARQGFITKSALPNVTRQRGTTTGTANLMLYGAGKNFAIGTNTTFTDSSTNNFTVTRNGDTIQATNNPFTGSVYFDGNGDYLSVGANAGFNFGTGDFTVEAWVYIAGNSPLDAQNRRIANVFFIGSSITTNFLFYIDGDSSTTGTKVSFYDGSSNLSGTSSLAQNRWHHIALTRSGTTLRIFLNGVVEGTNTSFSSSQGSSTNSVYIGRSIQTGYTFDLNGYITNLRVVKGTAVYTANFTVPTSPLTAITNTQLLLLTAQQAPFRDSSSNNFTVTANGNAAGSGLEPFPVNYAGSAYFDGTGDYLTVTNSAALQLTDATAFTIECWVYPTSLSGTEKFIIENYNQSSPFQGYGIRYSVSSSILEWWEGGASWVNTGITLTTNEWTHIAVTYEGSGTTRRFFKNGVLSGSAGTVSSGINYTAGACSIGAQEAGLFPWIGYISNLRIIKGTAQYTANFTPPSAPLTAVTNTSLLLLTNNVGPFVDTSANGFPVLRNGDAVQTGFSPFTGQPSAGSAYFDGTGDYLTIPNFSALQLTNSTAFTIECWVYPTNLTSPSKYIFENFNSSSPFQGYGLAYNINSTNAVEWWDGGGAWANTGIALTLNEWTHIAVTYEGSGTTRRFFKNGVLSGSAGTVSSSINYTAGACSIGAQDTNTPWFGYISNLRIIKGTAQYTSNFTPATAPLPAVPNTSLLLNTDNYTIANSTPTYLPVTVNGNTTVSTAQYPTGMNRSIYFDGNGDYLQVPDNTAFAFGTGDFTVECFMWLDSTASPGRIDNNKTVTIFSTGNSSTNDSSFAILGNTTTAGTGFEFFQYATPFNIALTVAVSIPTNTWNHIAYVRSGSNLYAFLNGVRYTLTTSLSASIGSSTAPKIGTANSTGYPNWFKGYLSNVRITKGSAIYTENFTAPTAPLSISVTVPNFVTNNIYGVYQLA